jgi:hypothetical protein
MDNELREDMQKELECLTKVGRWNLPVALENKEYWAGYRDALCAIGGFSYEQYRLPWENPNPEW